MSLLIHRPATKGYRAHMQVPADWFMEKGEIFVSSGWRMRHSRLSLALLFTGLKHTIWNFALIRRESAAGIILEKKIQIPPFSHLHCARSNQSAITSKCDGLACIWQEGFEVNCWEKKIGCVKLEQKRRKLRKAWWMKFGKWNVRWWKPKKWKCGPGLGSAWEEAGSWPSSLQELSISIQHKMQIPAWTAQKNPKPINSS